MTFGNSIKSEELFSKPKDEPVKPELEKVDLSARLLECLTNPDKNRPWFIILDEIKKENRGKNIFYNIKLKWADIPEGKKSIAANVLKAFLENDSFRDKAECIISIPKEENETLRKSYNSEFMSCYNAFASGVKLEVIE